MATPRTWWVLGRRLWAVPCRRLFSATNTGGGGNGEGDSGRGGLDSPPIDNSARRARGIEFQSSVPTSVRAHPMQLLDVQDVNPKRIFLLRDAESMGNVNPLLYATIPDNRLPLTKRGHVQAYDVGEKLKALIGEETVKFYVSPYLRTRQTFDGIVQWFDPERVEYQEEPRLREQDFGNWQSIRALHRQRQERSEFGSFYYRFPQGESGADVYDRVSTFLETFHREILRQRCAENFVLVSHGLTARLFLMRYFHWDVEYFQSLWNLDYCQIVILELVDGHYVLKTDLQRSEDGQTPAMDEPRSTNLKKPSRGASF